MKPQELASFVRCAKSDVSYNEEAKAKFLRDGKRVLRTIAKKLDLRPGSFDIRINPAGPAVSGEAILHSDQLYIMLSQSLDGANFMFRSVRGRKDYTGGNNHWMPWDKLLELDSACAQFQRVATRG